MTSCKPPPTCIDASPIPDANDSRMSAIPYEANLTPMGVWGQVDEPEALRHDQVRRGVPAGAVEPEHEDAIPSRPGLARKQRQQRGKERLRDSDRDRPTQLAREQRDQWRHIRPLEAEVN